MRKFLEGKELLDTVIAKLGDISPDDWAAGEIAYQLFKKCWAEAANDGDLQWDHATGGALHECALQVIVLRRRIAELESELQELRSKPN